MLYKMYYKSNIELNHLFVINIKCHNFLQVDVLIKNFKKMFGIFSSGWDVGRKPNPEPFSRGDRHGAGVSRSRPIS